MLTGKRVLVVDDEPGILRFTSAGLALAGCEVATTTSGEEALRLVKANEPDVVILDVLMVPMTGFDVLDRLRTFSQVPVIVFTARSFIAEQALKLGANGHIAKPFRPEELVKKIKEVLEGYSRSTG
jgi:DNA-binding response OmpR family regulator